MSVFYVKLFVTPVVYVGLQHEELTLEHLLNKYVTMESVDDVVCEQCQCSSSFIKKLTLGKACCHCAVTLFQYVCLLPRVSDVVLESGSGLTSDMDPLNLDPLDLD